MYRGYDLVAKAAKKNDYSITWGYICDCMKRDYGLSRNSNKWLSMGEVERMLQAIWDGFCSDVARKQKEGAKR